MVTPGAPRGGRVLARRYHLLRVLGRGAMGAVWEAEDTFLRRTVAVKEVVLPGSLSPEERAVSCERTLREARAIARLGHPNVVTLFDVLDEDSRPWVVMELVPSRSLADVIKEDGPLHPLRVATVGLAVLGALEAAHAAGITHRDVKPGNILLGHDGRVKLTDFGIARAAGDDTITGTGLLVGSPSYIAPEIIKGQEAGPPADLWGLGATLYAAAEGRAPFSGGDAMETLAKVVQEPPTPYEKSRGLIPALDAMLDKDPTRRARPVDARRLLLEVLRGGEEAAERPTPAPAAPPAPAPAAPTGPGLADLLVPVWRQDREGSRPPPVAAPAPAAPAPAAPAASTASVAAGPVGLDEGAEPGDDEPDWSAAEASPTPDAEPAAGDLWAAADRPRTGEHPGGASAGTEDGPAAGGAHRADRTATPAGSPGTTAAAAAAAAGGAAGAAGAAGLARSAGRAGATGAGPTGAAGPAEAAGPAGAAGFTGAADRADGNRPGGRGAPAGDANLTRPVDPTTPRDGATLEVGTAGPRTDHWTGAERSEAGPPNERWTPAAERSEAGRAGEQRAGADRNEAGPAEDAGRTTALSSWLPDSPGATTVLGTYGGAHDPGRPEDATQRIAPLPFGGPPPEPPRRAFAPAPGRQPDPDLPGGLLADRAPSDSRRRTVAALLTAVGLLVVAIVGGGLLLSGIGRDGGGDGSGPTTSPTEPAALPAGYTEFKGDGFTIGVPSAWKAEPEREGVVDLTEPGGDNRFLRLITVGGAKPAPALAQLEAAEAAFARNPAYEPYEQVRLENVDYRGYDTADWEFTFGKQQRHVLYRGIVVDGRTYGLYLSVPADRWEESRGAFQVAADTFRLTAGG